MNSIAEQRRAALQELVQSFGRGGISRVAASIKRDASYVSRLLYEPDKKGAKNIGEDVATDLKNAFPDFFAGDRTLFPQVETADGADQDRLPERDSWSRYEVNGRNIRPIWVVGKTMGGLPERIWGDGDYPAGALSDYAEEASADPNAFLCEVEGISMLERYAPGEYALIEPNTPVEAGDDVLVRLRTGETMLKRLDAMHNGYRLRSLNGGEQFFFYEADVSWVYYVAHPVPRRRIKTRY